MRSILFFISPDVLDWLLVIWAVGVVLAAIVIVVRGGSFKQVLELWPLAVVGLMLGVVFPRMMGSAGLPVPAWGASLVVAFLASTVLSVYRARRAGINPEYLFTLGIWFLVAGILGARSFYVIEYWPKFPKESLGETLAAIVNLSAGGMVVYGALLAGGAALVVFLYKYQLPGLAFTDLIAPGVVLGVALGRFGCFLNGCCYGGVCDLPWAVQFPAGSPAYLDQVEKHQLFVHGLIFKGEGNDPPVIALVEPDSPADRAGLKPGERLASINGEKVDSVDAAQRQLFMTFGGDTSLAIRIAGDPQPKSWRLPSELPRSRPVHPTQLYSLIDALLLCLLLLAYEPYKRWDGELTALVLVVHPISRFLLEIIRVDESAVFNTGMSISQNISIAIFTGGVLLYLYLVWRRPKEAHWPEPAVLAA